MGRILRVDLSKSAISTEPLSEEVARKYIGGRGLSAKILFDELEPGIDPLGPDNKMVIASGPMPGIPFAGNSRYSVCAKSPLGLGWGESYSGGYMAPKIKQSGFDAIIVEGVSKDPVSSLWGVDSASVLSLLTRTGL
jgi:aldehyde:ferredoxin oxidoreductase